VVHLLKVIDTFCREAYRQLLAGVAEGFAAPDIRQRSASDC